MVETDHSEQRTKIWSETLSANISERKQRWFYLYFLSQISAELQQAKKVSWNGHLEGLLSNRVIWIQKIVRHTFFKLHRYFVRHAFAFPQRLTLLVWNSVKPSSWSRQMESSIRGVQENQWKLWWILYSQDNTDSSRLAGLTQLEKWV